MEVLGKRLVVVTGKGGVGKTTVAAAIATELARRGLPVHLSTTDPAAHVAAAAGKMDGLQVSRIDPHAETKAYVEEVMARAGKDLDANGRALLEEDLRSPCTEEIAVFRAFARTVAQGQDQFVVLDTAPTGHTLLLLDATEAYHREIVRNASDMPEEVIRLLPRLRDPRFTRILIVTLPEATPVHEAAALQTDLRRAQIEPFAWIINQSLARAGTRDPLLLARGASELPFVHEVARQLSKRTAIVPWVAEEPIGPEKLRQLFELQPEAGRNVAIAAPTVLLYYAPQAFPCGENSTCCGPTGQTEQELQQYRAAVEQALPDVQVQTINVDKASGGKLKMNRDLAVFKLLNNFGYAACPIFAVNGEVISMGPPVIDELVGLVKEKLGATPRQAEDYEPRTAQP